MLRVLHMLCVAALLATVAVPPGRIASAQVTLGATLSVLAPVVEVASAAGIFAPARDGQTLQAGDQVRTGPSGVALLTFFDGSETQVTSDALVQIEAAAPGALISVFQLSGTSVSRVRPPSSTGGFQTDTPPATAFVRGTTYVTTTLPLVPTPGSPPAPLPPGGPAAPGAVSPAAGALLACTRLDVTTCATSAILLADPDGRVGRLGLIGRVSGTVELTNACDVGAASTLSRLSQLDPQTCADLQRAVLNLRDPAAAAATRAIAASVHATESPLVSAAGGGGGGGGPPGPPGGGGPGAGGSPGDAGGPGAIGGAETPAAGGGADAGGATPGASGAAAADAQPDPPTPNTEEAALALAPLEAPTPPAAVHVFTSNTHQTRFGIAEGHRNPPALTESGATWQRLIISWRAVQPRGPDDFSNLGKTLPADELEAELSRGVKVTALLQFTPEWAAANPALGERSPPKNLDLTVDDPSNYWARFVYETVKFYAGTIDEWIIWNEPEFRPSDPGAGDSATWLGSDEEFARLLQVAYQSAKRANPKAVVVFPGTSYWVEQNLGRAQFYERSLAILARQPDAQRNSLFHDAVALNLYRSPDDIVRVFSEFKAIQRRAGLDLPIWLTETNAMPNDDRAIAPCDHPNDAIPTTLEQQAAFAIQAFAIAAASGYARAGFYQMADDNPCVQPAVWGAVRDDATRRPAFDALKTAMKQFGPFVRARFAPVARAETSWAVWPEDPVAYWPNWQIYQVVFDLPGGRRLTVLWNGDGQAACVRLPRSGSGPAQLIDKRGNAHPATEQAGSWRVELAAATAHFAQDPNGYFFIGGDPLLLVEEGVTSADQIHNPITCAP